ncbi:MAG: hypothetical protein JNM27_13640 [Leptospirales bacterium]|nr:hypothetical protein [Leptospirales bacterium]
MKLGYKLDAGLSSAIRGNRLKSMADGSIPQGTQLFRPYPAQYNAWQDGAFKVVEDLCDNRSVFLATMDITRFYPSVRVSFSRMESDLGREYVQRFRKLQEAFKLIHLDYSEPKNGNTVALPIGLLSSSVIANWYLKRFDRRILKSPRIQYYSRYIDDIILVWTTNVPRHADLGASAIRELKDRRIIIPQTSGVSALRGFPHLTIQKEKLRFFFFRKNFSSASIKAIRKTIAESSSEFLFLPDDKSYDTDFQEAAYDLVFSESPHRLRSYREFTASQYRTSKHLARLLYLANLSHLTRPQRKKNLQQIHQLFTGVTGLQLFPLWEKVITLHLIYREFDVLGSWIKRLRVGIFRIAIGEEPKATRQFLQRHMARCLSLAFALNPEAVQHLGQIPNLIRPSAKAMRNLRFSNLVRHEFVAEKLINYTSAWRSSIDYTTIAAIRKMSGKETFRFDKHLLAHSPRYVHPDEICYFLVRHDKRMLMHDIENLYKDGNSLCETINNPGLHKRTELLGPLTESLISTQEFNGVKTFNLTPGGNFADSALDAFKKRTIKLAIANMQTYKHNVQSSFKGTPNKSAKRRRELFALLNDTIRLRQKPDLLILPELAIPFDWMPWISGFARKHQIGIICGFEYFIDRNQTAWNISGTFLPFTRATYKQVLPILRVKNHYAPVETKGILKAGLHLPPTPWKARYDLVRWRGAVFSLFNCYELANILHRAIFRSLVDFIAAIEWNKDTSYFGHIAESIVYDLHCYFAQSNVAHYGDSCVLAPKSKHDKQLLRLSGGQNSVVLMTTIPFAELRAFQDGSKPGEEFKPLPPDFDPAGVATRENQDWNPMLKGFFDNLRS